MDQLEQSRLRILRFTGSAVFSISKALIYFVSFLPAVLVLWQLRSLPPAALLALAIIAYGFSGAVFLLVLVLTKRALIGPVTVTGTHTIDNPAVKKWFAAAMLTIIQQGGLFRSITTDLSLFAAWYYRGMGARMPDSTLMGIGTVVFDPWFLEVGENVNIGAGALILGHLGHGKEIVLGSVVIGDGAIVGTRSIVMPNVRIGTNARVAAGAVVTQGTVIPDGEIWGGIPARRISQTIVRDIG